MLFQALFFSGPVFAGLLVREGFNGFDLGRRPAGWEFSGLGSEDIYDLAGSYGQAPPALKLTSLADQVVTETFSAYNPAWLSCWIKGIETNPSSALLIEEYYGVGGSWSPLTTILPLPVQGSVIGPLPLDPHTTRVRFAYDPAAGQLALDDVLVRSGPYLRVHQLSHTRLDESAAGGLIIYAELPGEDGLLDTADDVRILYDGGASSSASSALAAFLDERIGVGGIIHHMVLSHAHSDHYFGLAMAVDRYRVLNFYENYRGGSADYEAFRDKIDEQEIPVYYLDPGNCLSGAAADVGPVWDPRIEVKVLAARESGITNLDSLVLLVRNGGSSFLWGGDAVFTTEDDAVKNYPDDLAGTDIYTVHHHGDGLSSGQGFLSRMAPEYAVVPVAFRSTSRRPAAEAMDRINNVGAILYRNDLDHHVAVRGDASGNYEITRGYVWDGTYTSAADLVFSPPPLVAGLAVSQQTLDNVVLEWAAETAGDRYLVFRSLMAGGDDGAGRSLQPGMDPGEETGIYERLTASPISFTTFTDSSGVPGTTYHYRVAAVRDYTDGVYTTTQERRWSNEVSASRLPATPTPVTAPPASPTATTAPSPVPTPVFSPPVGTPTPVALSPSITPTPGIIRCFRLTGRVVDMDTGMPLSGATAKAVCPGGSSLVSDVGSAGDYELDICTHFQDGVVRTQARCPGYIPGSADAAYVNWAAESVVVAGDIELKAESLSSPGLVSGDYDGDGLAEIAVFRPSAGLWAIRELTRAYFGRSKDLPIPADYDGDGLSDIAVFRPSSGLWAVRGLTRIYFGGFEDIPVPGDYAGTGTASPGIFRPSSGLWAVRGGERIYFGGRYDQPVPGDYPGAVRRLPAVFRADSGLWLIRGVSRFYYGRPNDRLVPGDFDGRGYRTAGIFRPATGLWAIRGVTRIYFGKSGDYPVPADYPGSGDDEFAIFRPASGLWAVRGFTRTYFGTTGDIPVAR